MRKQSLKSVHELARTSEQVVFIGSDLGAGTLEDMRAELPSQWYMEGVSEQHIIGMAAGLAMEGFIPYVNTIATFLTRRCFEQVSIDLGLHQLPVRLIGNGGGVVYAPLGPTHQASEDIAIMRAIPNMTVVVPCDATEMDYAIRASIELPGPVYFRVAKGGDPHLGHDLAEFSIGKGITVRSGGDAAFLTTGVMAQRALAAAEKLATLGISCGVHHFHTIKPIDVELLESLAPQVPLMMTVEEHCRVGGLGSAVLETLNDRNLEALTRLIRVGLRDEFIDDYGSQDSLLAQAGLTSDNLVSLVRAQLSHKS